jgi:hypothetical protein
MTIEDKAKIEWSESIAAIIVDALVDSGTVKIADFKDAVEVVAVELFVRLLVGDYPPPFDAKLLTEGSAVSK